MPFGLKNAPSTFQRSIDIILASVKWQYAIEYLDDIIVFSSTVEEHKWHLRSVLGMLRNAGMSLKLHKCFFLQKRVEYLGHIVSPGQLAVQSKTCDAIIGMAPPTNLTKLRSLLVLCNVCHRSVKNFARIADPLRKRLHKTKDPTFRSLNDVELEAFELLKAKLTSPPVISLPKAGLEYVVDTDACYVQVGFVLQKKAPRRNDSSIRILQSYTHSIGTKL